MKRRPRRVKKKMWVCYKLATLLCTCQRSRLQQGRSLGDAVVAVGLHFEVEMLSPELEFWQEKMTVDFLKQLVAHLIRI